MPIADDEYYNLQSALDGKAPTVHTHTIANVTDLQSALDGKAPTVHTHTIANVTDLQSALDSKQPLITDSGWLSLTFAANFTNWTDVNYTPCNYRKIGSVVQLCGLSKNSVTGAGQVVGTLPAGYRPPKHLILTAYSSIGLIELRIYSNGAIVVNSNLNTTNGWQSITCMFFV